MSRSPLKTRVGPSIRIPLLLVLVGGLAIAPGCGKHRRSAYRPVYVDPAPVYVDEAPGVEVVVPSSPSNFSEPPLATPEGFSDGFSSYSTPVPPPAEEIMPRVAPPDEGEEPELEEIPRNEETVPSNVQPNSFSPQTRRDAPGTASPTAARRSALRLKVQSLADDPTDLVQPPKAERPWRYVVLHHSARADGSHAELDREHRDSDGLSGCGYHFVIGNGTGSADGAIEVTRRWSEQLAGAYCQDVEHPQANEYGISVCLIGDLDQASPTPRQVESARLLVAYLQGRYAIAADRVETHSALARSSTTCPGRQFPAEAILGRSHLAAR